MTAEGSSSSRPETGGTTSTSSGDSEKDLQLKRKSSKAYEEEEEEDLQLQRKTSQAYEEGHDADIPSSAGYVLNEKGEQMRKNYLERRRSNTINEKSKSNGTIQRDVEAGAPSQGAEHENDDPNVVWWDGPDDPENPYNWPQWRKVANCSLISGMTFLTPLGSSIFAPGVPEVLKEFGSTSKTLAAFVVSVYVVGFAFGPLIMAPLSEIYGRVPIYHVCNLLFVAMSVGCALAPTLNALIGIRFLAGVFGCAAITNGGGTIADMIPQENRGTALVVFSIGPLLGPVIGPIAGGFLTEAAGWRWTFWLITIISGLLSVCMVPILRESYAHIILERKAARLRKETNNPLLRSRLDIGLSPTEYFRRSINRPLKMLFCSPVVFVSSFYVALTYGYLYLMFTTMTEVFQDTYGFGTGIVGLAYLGIGIGNLIGAGYISATSDRYIRKKAAEAEQEGGEDEGGAVDAGITRNRVKPEHRLPSLPLGAFLLPVGLFIYGWTCKYHVHWIVPILSHVPIGIGNMIIFMSVQMYMVDAFTMYAASALAANTLLRSVVGGVLPMAGLPMYSALGYGWGNSILGFIAIATIPLMFALLKWGEMWRTKYAIKNL